LLRNEQKTCRIGRNIYNPNYIKIQGILTKSRAGGFNQNYGYKSRPKLEEV